ncbi:Microfibrillar-associated protein 1 [Borealophlyctis nickersoniae]|nr:Microfibrillar-associated protein 1 [Borealophlyctis nickersoniae]
MSKPAPRARPVRYWPGKAPKGAEEHPSSSDSEQDDDDFRTKNEFEAPKKEEEITEFAAGKTTSVQDAQSDRRLRRLMQSRAERGEAKEEEAEERPGRGRASRVETVEPVKEEESEEEDEEGAEERRRRLRERALQKRKEEDEALEPEEDEEEEEDSSSEYTTDSEDDPTPSRTLMKPVFIPKKHRETILEKERLEKEAAGAEEKRLKEIEERKKESHDMVAEELRKETVAVEAANGPVEVDDKDGVDEDGEYAAWKLRELRRIKRDRDEKENRIRQAEELERRRLMTDAEIEIDNARNGKDAEKEKKEKAKLKFLQRYYHRGAFYTDDDKVSKVLQRDVSAATLEDKFDKTSLPAVMQVKNFGRAGQTKWTHLADQDTTQRDSAWAQNTEINKRTLNKMGGMKGGFEKPTKRRKL